LSRNLGALTSWGPLDHFRPVMGLLYLFTFLDMLVIIIIIIITYHSWSCATR